MKRSIASRRKFLQQSLALSVTGQLSVSNANEAPRLACEPYLQDPKPDAMTIQWICERPSYSWVEFGTTEQLGQKAHRVTHGLVDSYNRINQITLQDLQAGTTYYYRVFSREITEFKPYKLTYGDTVQSKLYQFTTPAQQPTRVRALILNDIHDRPESFAQLLKLDTHPGRDFVFLNGDIFDYQTDEQQLIDHLLKPATEQFASQTPFYYVRGNHETRGKFRREWFDYFRNPEGKPYFDWTWGPVHFIALDTGEDKPDAEPVYAGLVDFDAYRQEQARWLERVMQGSAFKKAAFRVVLMHIPPQYSGDWHGATHVKQLFSPLFDRYKIDVTISGHTHTYGVHLPVKGQHSYPVVIGGGPKAGNRTLIQLNADAKNLSIRLIRDDGQEVGTYTKTRSGK
ncbi:metallophosphoesterase [Siphonobacter sp. BAB-5405]|uniref:FN3 domain-containing metallophosphoesterase family protein n=1 Tax=Siphonobacter sp. BAB-5405 TaxID=1864825 RepID=UPI000C806A3C|nr:FN3 domain-containing metallophosphoesterase family protein [Siphonobacter sp. BAB-5405]PMD91673.1 metallophosphoesterase [Siphonobacter sp. BAB-5405]